MFEPSIAGRFIHNLSHFSAVRILYTLTIFVGSALLFLVEPMVAKMILPVFGGSPAVWNACVVFFQLMLLLGYAYAHGSVKLIGANRQPVLHLVVIALALIVLPFGVKAGYSPAQSGQPAFQVVGLLLVMVGLPFFAVAAQAPLLQRWFATTKDPHAHDPYFLYSASNLGSMLALIAYPTIIESLFALNGQSTLWTGGYIALGVLTLGSALGIIFQRKHVAEVEAVSQDDAPPTNRERLRWVLLSAAPSSLMLGITTYITTNIAPVPLLWVIPLSIYLLTFILAFSNRIHPKTTLMSRLTTILVLPIALVLVLELWSPMLPLAAMHLFAFFMLAWTCHTLMVRSRPSASHLTEFYLWIAAGGVLGGAFNGFVAPVVFRGLIEYPIALAVAVVMIQPGPKLQRATLTKDLLIGAAVVLICLGLTRITPQFLSYFVTTYGDNTEAGVAMLIMGVLTFLCFFFIDKPIRYGIAICSLMILGPAMRPEDASVIFQTRNFFGVKKVTREGRFHDFLHGTTVHGKEDMTLAGLDKPTTYYSPISPVGRVFKEFSGPKMKKSIAVVGLGTGTMAAYGEPGMSITYYEIDPQVIDIATNPKYFTYINHSKAKVNIVQGDARLELLKAPDHSFDIIFLDAFSSDSIPVHLLTTEAMQMYFTKLKPDGFLAFHTSNRYLDLPPVLARAGKQLGMKCIYLSMDILSQAEEDMGWSISRWLLMGHSYDDFGSLGHQLMWTHMDTPPAGPVWTDDFSNVLSAFAPNE